MPLYPIASRSPRGFRIALLAGTSVLTLSLAGMPVQALQLATQRGGSGVATAQVAAQALASAQQSSAVAQQTMSNLLRANQAVQAMQQAQVAARAAAANAASAGAGLPAVPNGLAVGGLQVATGATAGSSLWQNASLPTQSVSNGQTLVNIKQQAAQAILTWQTFNVGKQTLLNFDQQGNSNWVALNRVIDPSGLPSQILGQIKASGQVYVINHNGIVFGGASQVNVGSLIASTADITDSQFQNNGIYSVNSNGYVPSFTDAGGAVVVDEGAQISTNAPASVTSGGGFVLMMGSAVTNAGTILTPNGQTELAAGDNFILRPGYSTTANATSTTDGNEIAPVVENAGGAWVAGGGGQVENDGYIEADTGDITLAGETVVQNGVALSTTSTAQRGTIHLLASASDPQSSVTLTGSSVTTIMPDSSGGTALNAQLETLLSNSATENTARSTLKLGQFDDLSLLADNEALSRVEIVSGGTVEFANGSQTVVPGGQIAVSAVNRVQADTGALLDVAGDEAVLSVAANDILVNIQGNEQRDDPTNRDTDLLNNANVYVDERQLTFVAAGAGGYATDRYYTEGGLLEVSGWLNNTGHTIEEWLSTGGTITLATGSKGSIVAQSGAIFNISGGDIRYQGGYVAQSYLLGSDGNIYNVNDAPADLTYSVYDGFVVDHAHWGITQDFGSSLFAPSKVYEQGYTDGQNAGSLILSTPTALFDGTIQASVTYGVNQVQAPATTDLATYISNGGDPFLLAQTNAPLAGTLALGQYTALGLFGAYDTAVDFGKGDAGTASTLGAVADIPAALADTADFNAAALSSFGLGGLSVATQGSVKTDQPLSFAAGAQVTFAAPTVDIASSLTAPSGAVTVSDTIPNVGLQLAGQGITLEGTGVIDTRGLWSNTFLSPNDAWAAAFVNGGDVSLQTTQSLVLAAGSLIDASAGGTVSSAGKVTIGDGGAITAVGDKSYATGEGTFSESVGDQPVVLAGTLQSIGAVGGALTLGAGSIVIGAAAGPANDAQVVLQPSFFQQGFSSYTLDANDGITIAPGTDVEVTEPVYIADPWAINTPSGANPAAALSVVLQPLYVFNASNDTLTQRPGASLSLRVAGLTSTAMTGALSVGQGATLAVDPGSNITLTGPGQIDVDGTLRAPGGTIDLINYASNGKEILPGGPLGVAPGGNSGLPGNGNVSIWLGPQAVVDASGIAATAFDASGNPFSVAQSGGTIKIGGPDQTDTNFPGYTDTTDAFIEIAPGAVLEASGASAVTTVREEPGRSLQNSGVTETIAGAGGSIILSSDNGMALDGTLIAAAGNASAAGGSLSILLEGPLNEQRTDYPSDDVFGGAAPSEIIISQNNVSSGVAASAVPLSGTSLPFQQVRIGADQLAAGGFTQLSLDSSNFIIFDGNVDLSLGQSISFVNGYIGDTNPNATVSVRAPYVYLGGMTGTGGDLVDSHLAFDPALSAAVGWQPSTQTGTGTFSVAADQIDVENYVYFGDDIGIPVSSNESVPADIAGFQLVTLTSAGDLRFLTPRSRGTNGGENNTELGTADSLTLDAAQVYAASGTIANVYAGLTAVSGSFNQVGILTIGRTTTELPDIPDSVGGTLGLFAYTIDQGGVVRVPLGTLTLGESGFTGSTQAGGSFGLTHTLNLLPGSFTSISANGLDMPYGGTSDGTTYSVDGTQISTTNTLQAGVSGRYTISLGSDSINVESGATLDISGGGTLQGEGFVSGEGGSVNVLTTPLVNANPAYSGLSSSSSQVYAIVPSSSQTYAPNDAESQSAWTGNMPSIGAQITITAGVPGLPAGTYTLLPATYALLPGAFRVEIGNKPASVATYGSIPLAGGSYTEGVYEGIANTSVRSTLQTTAIITPGSAVRTMSQFDETGYGDFLSANAQATGAARPALPQDAGALTFNYANAFTYTGTSVDPVALTFDGTLLQNPGQGGNGGSVDVVSDVALEITAGTPTTGFTGVSLSAAALDAIGADSLVIGGVEAPELGTADVIGITATATSIVLRDGATLRAPQVFLTAMSSIFTGATGAITIEPGAAIDTLGLPAPTNNSGNALLYDRQGNTLLAVSNANLNFATSADADASGPISIGVATSDSNASSTLYGEGTIALGTDNTVSFGNLQIGAANLDLLSDNINFGTPPAGATVPTGLTLTDSMLATLLAGNSGVGIPKLQSLILTGAQAINFFGTVDIEIGNSTSQPTVELDTPTIEGLGGDGDVATLQAGTLIWNGIAGSGATGPVDNGPGTGTGTLDFIADHIVLGYPADSQPNPASLSRTVLGFNTVVLEGDTDIVANNNGTLSVSQDSFDPTSGTFSPVTGAGDLVLKTPLLTTESGATFSATAGGAITITTPDGVTPILGSSTPGLGGSLTFNAGGAIEIDTTIALPSGSLSLTAESDPSPTSDVTGITLGSQATLDLAGQAFPVGDQVVDLPGGTVTLVAAAGDVMQDLGSTIDVSSVGAAAGSLSITATDPNKGMVELNGTLLGSGPDDANSGTFIVSAQTLGGDGLTSDFATLNGSLDNGGFYGARSFDLKAAQNLAIGNLKAHSVTVSVDNGKLTVNGTIDASGPTPGSIVLAAENDLTLNGTLDAQSTKLQQDSNKNAIDAENRATVNLTTVDGTLTLGNNSKIDVSSQDLNGPQGDVELNVPRGTPGIPGTVPSDETTGDAKIEAGTVTIVGAQTIALNAFWVYTPTDPNGTIVQDDGDALTPGIPMSAVNAQGYVGLDQIDNNSQIFINSAWANINSNGDLGHNLAGLLSDSAFHLRPGIEIKSATSAGDLTTLGDLDMSEFRYGPNATGNGAGEPGVLVIRAGGNVNIGGSITDGFGNSTATASSNGWTLNPGQGTIGDAIAAAATTLPSGTTITNATESLGYDVNIAGNTIIANAKIPLAVTTSDATTLSTSWTTTAPITLNLGPGTFITTATIIAGNKTIPAGTTLSGTVLIPAGSILGAGTTLPIGSTLGQGTVLPVAVGVVAMELPAGTPLNIFSKDQITLTQDAPIIAGEKIIAGTSVVTPASGVLYSDTTLPNDVTFDSAVTISGGPDFDPSQSVLVGGSDLTLLTSVTVDLSVGSVDLISGSATPIPFSFAIEDVGLLSLSSSWEATADVYALGSTTPLFTTGQMVPAGTSLFFDVIGAGAYDLPAGLSGSSGTAVQILDPSATGDLQLPAGTNLSIFDPASRLAFLNSANVIGTVAAGSYIGTASVPSAPLAARPTVNGIQGYDYATAALLPAGSLSWSIRVVAGADLTAANTSTLLPAATLNGSGNLNLADAHTDGQSATPSFSVIRTGTGNLDLLAGGSIDEGSEYGVYTAGTQAAPPSSAGADFTTGGGDLTVTAQGDLTGYTLIQNNSVPDSNAIANWLWRTGVDGAQVTWGINFGSFNASGMLVGFTGFGTLGGGNVTVDIGGDAGIITNQALGSVFTQGLDITVASTGQVIAGDATPTEYGGGQLSINIGGVLDPTPLTTHYENDVYGTFTNLRGGTSINAGAIGTISLSYGAAAVGDPRAVDPYTAEVADAIGDNGSIVLVPGDGTFNVTTRSNLVIGGYGNAGLVVPATSANGDAWFSLWTSATAVNLLSLGGDIMPEVEDINNGDAEFFVNDAPAAGTFWLPPQLSIVAPSGSFFANTPIAGTPFELAPSIDASFEILVGQSIYDGGIAGVQNAVIDPGTVFDISGASLNSVATPSNPAWWINSSTNNLNPDWQYVQATTGFSDPLVAFGPDTASGNLDTGNSHIALIEAASGDIVNLQFGQITSFGAEDFSNENRNSQTWYTAAIPAEIIAGRDIVNLGTPLPANSNSIGGTGYGLILNNEATDISLIQAGRNILYANMDVAGPGLLLVQAGENVYQAGRGSLQSLGTIGSNVNSANQSGGAGITVLAGLGTDGPDYTDFATTYLDAAQSTLSLSDSASIIAGDDAQLATWLKQYYGDTGVTAVNAYATFEALPAGKSGTAKTLAEEQQQIFLRQIYYNELNQGGLEFNQPSSVRFQSYVRGKDAIASLFPADRTYSGSLTMADTVSNGIVTGADSIVTQSGGPIQIMTPGGETIVGVNGVNPPGNAGLITEGSDGDIDVYSLDSVLLGQSRIFTTFGGNIVIWSATGDINAGKGTKTTQVYTPPERVYDHYGDVKLSPTVPSTGAGIAALQPIPEVPPGNVNLVAPEGIVDAGEAGIRVSGNFNVAALQVINAANITVQGTSTGIPTVPAPNVGALDSASSAAGAAVKSIISPTDNKSNAIQPSILIVEVEGYGGDDSEPMQSPPSDDKKRTHQSFDSAPTYDDKSAVQIAGYGTLSGPEAKILTAAERMKLDGR